MYSIYASANCNPHTFQLLRFPSNIVPTIYMYTMPCMTKQILSAQDVKKTQMKRFGFKSPFLDYFLLLYETAAFWMNVITGIKEF